MSPRTCMPLAKARLRVVIADVAETLLRAVDRYTPNDQHELEGRPFPKEGDWKVSSVVGLMVCQADPMTAGRRMWVQAKAVPLNGDAAKQVGLQNKPYALLGAEARANAANAAFRKHFEEVCGPPPPAGQRDHRAIGCGCPICNEQGAAARALEEVRKGGVT